MWPRLRRRKQKRLLPLQRRQVQVGVVLSLLSLSSFLFSPPLLPFFLFPFSSSLPFLLFPFLSSYVANFLTVRKFPNLFCKKILFCFSKLFSPSLYLSFHACKFELLFCFGKISSFFCTLSHSPTYYHPSSHAPTHTRTHVYEITHNIWIPHFARTRTRTRTPNAHNWQRHN